MLAYARTVGGPNLRALTFHDRARMLRALARHLDAHKKALCDLSFDGAMLAGPLPGMDGGIGTMFVFASKGRREPVPDLRRWHEIAPAARGVSPSSRPAARRRVAGGGGIA